MPAKEGERIVLMFWVMKTSSRIRIRKPAINDVHKAPARVNLDAGSLVGGLRSASGSSRFLAWDYRPRQRDRCS